MAAEERRSNDAEAGLPPVVPPSGKFIAQLFIVPFVIVVSIVCFLLTFTWLMGGAQKPADFLKKVDSPNADVRWRGAEELAQYLPRDPELASDPKFALDIAERLERAQDELAGQEKLLAEQRRAHPADPQAGAPEAVKEARSGVNYLSSCLGSFIVPVGAPVLGKMALDTSGGDPRAVAARRRRAVWSLAKLGDRAAQFDKLPEPKKEIVLKQLDEELPETARGTLAAQAKNYLAGQERHSLATLGLDRVFQQLADDPDPFIRLITAFALTFWEGTPAENARLDELLLKLAHDNGRGEDQAGLFREKDEDDELILKSPSTRIRYNAVLAQAHRGSARVRLGVLKEMLDEESLRKILVTHDAAQNEIPDQDLIIRTIQAALVALVTLHERNPSVDLISFEPILANLEHSKNPAIRAQALQAKLALAKKT